VCFYNTVGTLIKLNLYFVNLESLKCPQ
jgi:hypothetical protein